MTSLSGTDMYGGYAGTDILRGCSVRVDGGELVVVVGPNGAGKSTAMKALLGMLRLRQGQVLYNGEDISSLPAPQRIQKGIGFVPQTHNVFPGMSVAENLEMGAFLCPQNVAAASDRAYALFPTLKDKRNQLAGQLSGGQRQQVAIARAMMTDPAVLLLDEPTAGVSPLVVSELFERIREIRTTGTAVMMVEQNASQALAIADRGYVLAVGKNFRSDTGSRLLADAQVQASFLGG